MEEPEGEMEKPLGTGEATVKISGNTPWSIQPRLPKELWDWKVDDSPTTTEHESQQTANDTDQDKTGTPKHELSD